MAAAGGLFIGRYTLPSSIVAYIARCCLKSATSSTETDDVSVQDAVTSQESDVLTTSAKKKSAYDSVAAGGGAGA